MSVIQTKQGIFDISQHRGLFGAIQAFFLSHCFKCERVSEVKVSPPCV